MDPAKTAPMRFNPRQRPRRLDAGAKAEIGNILCPQDYFDNSPCMRADLATFIAIMEASLANHTVAEKGAHNYQQLELPEL